MCICGSCIVKFYKVYFGTATMMKRLYVHCLVEKKFSFAFLSLPTNIKGAICLCIKAHTNLQCLLLTWIWLFRHLLFIKRCDCAKINKLYQ